MDNQNTTTNHTVGLYVGGNLTANTIINNVNQPSSSSKITRSKSPFRYNIPTPTRHFKGRRDTMEAVRDYFITLPPQPKDWRDRTAAIVGLAGMGKTETAYKLAEEFKETFPNVAVINAETESSALASFLGLAKHRKIVSNDLQTADLDLVREVYQHIGQEDNGMVLLIFDNAIRLHSHETEFGIMEYLPTYDLPNKRFPFVLITTQTNDWDRQMETFKVVELSEVESLEFFRSCFQITSPECDDLFRELHKLLVGYPLVMNLVASQLDYNPKRPSVHQLERQIQAYIDKLQKENNKILHEKFNRSWPTKYQKTLSNVWQLTFERIQQEENGRDALELLQLMSFLQLPIHSDDVVRMSVRSSDCPHPLKIELEFRLRALIRILERFYTLRILRVYDDDEDAFSCSLGIHRLVQFVVRQQVDSSTVLERVLVYFASDYKNNCMINKSALEEALHRIPLSQRALPYVGFAACYGFLAACKLVETRPPDTKAAATIWRLYHLKRGVRRFDENATRVLRELIQLTKSAGRLVDRYFFGDITMNLLTNKWYCAHESQSGTSAPGCFFLKYFKGIEKLVCQLILNVCSLQDFSCKFDGCESRRERTHSELSRLTTKLSKTFIDVSSRFAPKSFLRASVPTDVIADTWFALFASLNYPDPTKNKFLPHFLEDFWVDIYVAFHSPNARRYRIGDLKRCLWNRGIAKELIQQFGFMSHYFNRLDYPDYVWVLRIMEFSIEGMDLRDERVQEVISSICQLAARVETELITEDYSHRRVCWMCFTVSFWVKLFLMSEDPPLHKFLDSLSQLKFLEWMERSPRLNGSEIPYFGLSMRYVPAEYRLYHFPNFIERFSSSDIKPIKKLVKVIRRLMEDYKWVSP